MNEFDLIRTFFAPLAGPEGLYLKDDAACYTPPPGYDLVVTTDMMVEGVHFPFGEYGQRIGERLLRVNLSDLAAKGAAPIGYQLSLALPEPVETKHLSSFAQGLLRVQKAYDFTLWGGDTVKTSGPMTISATLIGLVPEGSMLRRAGARAGQDVWVTGIIGQGYLGLKCLQQPITIDMLSKAEIDSLIDAYYEPAPQIDFGITLRSVASASADISDGLIADASHIANSSEVGIELVLDDIPFSSEALKWIAAASQPMSAKLALITGGDDYQIVFTAPCESLEQVKELANEQGIRVTRIGTCTPKKDIVLKNSAGDKIHIENTGYQHF